jgi:hypothetical protein
MTEPANAPFPPDTKWMMDDLGSEDLQEVLSRLATDRHVEADSAVANSTDMLVRELVAVEEKLRSALDKAYRSLAFSELDADGMLRRRLDLARAFGFPYYANRVYTVLPKDLSVDRLVDLDPSVSAEFRYQRFQLSHETKVELLGALPVDLGRSDIVKFVTAKNRLDDWFRRTSLRGKVFDEMEVGGLAVFRRLAEQIRTDDPMTAPGSEFGEQLERIRRAAEQIDGARDAAQAAAGQTADAALSTHFAADADSDGKTAAGLSIGSLVSLVAAFGVGVMVIGDLENVGIATELAKLALTLPLLAISAYLGRLSTHYRESARWAKTAAVQLKTIDAFTQGVVEDVNRDEMKLMLGKRIFSDPGFGNDGKNPDVADLVALVEAIGNAVKTKE